MSKQKPIDMNARPAFQKWVEPDFVMKTTLARPMHWLARLIYRGLLQQAFHCSTRPNLPDDDAQLCAMLGGVPAKVWKEHRAAVRQWFTPQTIDGVKVLTHTRLQSDWQNLLGYRKEQREKANRSWDVRRKRAKAEAASSNGNATAQPRVSSGNATAEPVQCQSESESEVEKESELENESHSILHPANEGMNDGQTNPQPSPLKVLESAFSEATGGLKFRVGRTQKAPLLALIDQHGVEVMRDAVERFAGDNHDWSQVNCPAGLFLSHAVEAYIG